MSPMGHGDERAPQPSNVHQDGQFDFPETHISLNYIILQDVLIHEIHSKYQPWRAW